MMHQAIIPINNTIFWHSSFNHSLFYIIHLCIFGALLKSSIVYFLRFFSQKFVKILANILVSKFFNIGIGGQLNIYNWPNIGEIFLKISVTKIWYWLIIQCFWLLYFFLHFDSPQSSIQKQECNLLMHTTCVTQNQSVIDQIWFLSFPYANYWVNSTCFIAIFSRCVN